MTKYVFHKFNTHDVFQVINTTKLNSYYILKNVKKSMVNMCRTVDHRIGKTDEDEPNIPILSLKEAQISLFLRTFIIIVNLITCFFIVANIIHKW